jgi:hypothetical protein
LVIAALAQIEACHGILKLRCNTTYLLQMVMLGER